MGRRESVGLFLFGGDTPGAHRNRSRCLGHRTESAAPRARPFSRGRQSKAFQSGGKFDGFAFAFLSFRYGLGAGDREETSSWLARKVRRVDGALRRFGALSMPADAVRMLRAQWTRFQAMKAE